MLLSAKVFPGHKFLVSRTQKDLFNTGTAYYFLLFLQSHVHDQQFHVIILLVDEQ